MSIFDGQRLSKDTLQLDIEGLRHGQYSDKYFENVTQMLTTLSKSGYTFQMQSSRLSAVISEGASVGNMEVEAQWFTRRQPTALIGGIDIALLILRHCSGYFDDNGAFVNTWNQLEVEAMQDGSFIHYDGDPLNVTPVLKVRGVYRYFAMLETPTLGVLTRITRIATNVYETLVAARGKPVLYFPARFDLPEAQAADGYAYHLAVQRYNLDYKANLRSFVSTDAQAAWWGGSGGGTVPHAIIACFLGNTAEAMLCFAATQPMNVPRIALVDFDNDCVGTSLAVTRIMFERYRELKQAGHDTEAEKFRLSGVRLDTSNALHDISIEPKGNAEEDMGVNPTLVLLVRQALDHAWQSWDLPQNWQEQAEAYCRNVKIVVTGGFTAEKIDRFEQRGVPADIYGVGSSLLTNDKRTNSDFTTDVVRVKLRGQWYIMAKVGRQPCPNPDLAPIPPDFPG
jgi:nicotinate phosphoribosyltransferase